MKIRMKSEQQQNNEHNKRKENENHKKFRQLRKGRNSRWQSLD